MRTPKRTLDGMEPAVTTSSPRSALAAGNINGSDRIVVELLSPPDMPQVIMIRWPQHFTVVAPTHFPYVDIWQAVKPARFGMAGWPEVPRTVEWKHGICAALALPHRDQTDLAAAWRMILDQVRSWDDLERPLLTVVEQLIDFVTDVPQTEWL